MAKTQLRMPHIRPDRYQDCAIFAPETYPVSRVLVTSGAISDPCNHSMVTEIQHACEYLDMAHPSSHGKSHGKPELDYNNFASSFLQIPTPCNHFSGLLTDTATTTCLSTCLETPRNSPSALPLWVENGRNGCIKRDSPGLGLAWLSAMSSACIYHKRAKEQGIVKREKVDKEATRWVPECRSWGETRHLVFVIDRSRSPRYPSRRPETLAGTMMLLLRYLITSAALFGGLGLADTCSEVEAFTNIEVSRPPSLSYITEQMDYWSTSCSALKPSCIIFPRSADEVAAVVRILRETDEDFAVKSGGHNPNNYFASVQGGPLISTSKLDHVLLDRQTGIARVGPGQRLDSIADVLDGTGWTFVGGRIGNTGVGGLILGGGLSYMSAQYGWSASSVYEFEVVLANGTIVAASETNHPDLFKALKGGGNNFGIVTTYVLQTYRQGDVWGGNLAYPIRSKSKDAQLLRAVRDFTEYNDDDKAAVIVTAERANLNLVDSWIVFLFYDGPQPPAHVFKNFTDAGPLVNTCRTRTYADLIGNSNWVIVPGSNVQMATETIPLPPAEHGADMFDALHSHWREVSKTTLAVPGIVASIAYQPIPRAIAREARARGDDLISADDDADRLIIEMNYSFIPPSKYDEMADTLEATYSGFRERVLEWQEEGKLPDVYLPLAMNYGFYRQDYFGRLKPENSRLAAEVARSVDPYGLFRNRTGGWKPY
ncbi:FAD-binding domain-containing protein [Sodiomyces alkalinus F11]|uniref:FAD-binding domain-containing protein n=1 Tax=Sodiomyces alkalinus (strain CBS 110278 / VKM F-3762 / F11) TaxID=1314773 RepID=A0A3N2Q8U9_SODAK|nr:FAD-binding domain-containing protein [Sodiomyces alkalinus F11]ROT43182.1 FAD-binding domain-containing protein [Sodiomyces alkalinus F11]